MKGIVNWYSDRKKCGYIEGKDGRFVRVNEKDLPFITVLHPGDFVEYLIEKTSEGLKAVQLKEITKKIYYS